MSRRPGPENHDPFSPLLPPRTPGPLGRNDAGDPTVKALLGDLPGPLGVQVGVHVAAGKLAWGWGGSDDDASRRVWVRPNLRGLRPMGQALATLCWLTCYQMLYIWKGLDPRTIEGKLRGATGVDYDGACKRGLLDDEIPVAARALGLTPAGVGGSISASDLKQLLAFSPVWVAGEWFRNGKHVRLVTGANDDWVEFIDPWFGDNEGGQADFHTHLIGVFVHGDGNVARGTDKLIGKLNMSYWK